MPQAVSAALGQLSVVDSTVSRRMPRVNTFSCETVKVLVQAALVQCSTTATAGCQTLPCGSYAWPLNLPWPVPARVLFSSFISQRTETRSDEQSKRVESTADQGVPMGGCPPLCVGLFGPIPKNEGLVGLRQLSYQGSDRSGIFHGRSVVHVRVRMRNGITQCRQLDDQVSLRACD